MRCSCDRGTREGWQAYSGALRLGDTERCSIRRREKGGKREKVKGRMAFRAFRAFRASRSSSGICFVVPAASVSLGFQSDLHGRLGFARDRDPGTVTLNENDKTATD